VLGSKKGCTRKRAVPRGRRVRLQKGPMPGGAWTSIKSIWAGWIGQAFWLLKPRLRFSRGAGRCRALNGISRRRVSSSYVRSPLSTESVGTKEVSDASTPLVVYACALGEDNASEWVFRPTRRTSGHRGDLVKNNSNVSAASPCPFARGGERCAEVVFHRVLTQAKPPTQCRRGSPRPACGIR
jgi:hypothetical protein